MSNEELIDEIYTLNLQNMNEKSDFDRAYKQGIEDAVNDIAEKIANSGDIIPCVSVSLEDIRAEGKMMATCSDFVNETLNNGEEGYKEAYMKGLNFALNKVVDSR